MGGNDAFFVVKGVIGLIAVGLLVVHMNRSWHTFDRDPVTRQLVGKGQRLRYVTLFAAVVLLTGASAEQIHDAAKIESRNVGAMVVAVLALYSAIVSVREASPRRSDDPTT
jgi:hypothetical protein